MIADIIDVDPILLLVPACAMWIGMIFFDVSGPPHPPPTGCRTLDEGSAEGWRHTKGEVVLWIHVDMGHSSFFLLFTMGIAN